MRETSVIAPTAPCGRADPSAFYGDPDLPHLAAPSQASECHWHRSYHRDSSLTQAMALPSVPISEPTWLPNNSYHLLAGTERSTTRSEIAPNAAVAAGRCGTHPVTLRQALTT